MAKKEKFKNTTRLDDDDDDVRYFVAKIESTPLYLPGTHRTRRSNQRKRK